MADETPAQVPAAALRPNVYKVLERAVEDGVRYGYRRAFKHNDHPSEEAICEAVENAVMSEIGEWFEFGDG